MLRTIWDTYGLKMKDKMDTETLLRHLSNFHDPKEWAFFEELRIGTGFGKDSEQRLDAWAIHYHPSKRNVTRSYELKVSKGDFNNEVNKPFKRRPALRLSNESYIVTPLGLLSDDDINKLPEVGFMEFSEDGKVFTRVLAPYRDILPPTWLFVAALCRRFDKARCEKYLMDLEHDKALEDYGQVTRSLILNNVNKWRNIQIGSKEVPDKIADALVELNYDIEEAVKLNKRLRNER